MRVQTLLKILPVAIALIPLSVPIVDAREYEVKKKAGPYTVIMAIERNPPAVGDNGLRVGLTDGSGRAVTDATVLVEVFMAPMPGMPAMLVKSKTTLAGGVYVGKVNFCMAGPHSVTLKVTREGKTVQTKFNVDAR